MAFKNKQAARKVFELECRICKALAHPVRLEIVELLNQRSMSATALRRELETSKANLSKHAAVLIDAGILESSREGREVSYGLAHREIHEASKIMRSILYNGLKQASAARR